MTSATAAPQFTPKFVHVDHEGSDWAGIYRDGQKVSEGHPLEPAQILELLGFVISEISDEDEDFDAEDPTAGLDEEVVVVWSRYPGSDYYEIYRDRVKVYRGDAHEHPQDLLDVLDIPYEIDVVERSVLSEGHRGLPDLDPTAETTLQSA